MDTSVQVLRMLWDMFFFDFEVLLEEYRKSLLRLEGRSLPCRALGKLWVRMFDFVDVGEDENDADTNDEDGDDEDGRGDGVGSCERACVMFIV
jgi:hypothetical protein